MTSKRRTSSLNKAPRDHRDGAITTYGRMELDSHADTIVLGSNAIVMHYTTRECDVSPYSDANDPIKNVSIVTGATVVTGAETGMTLILLFNEAIWMGDLLDHSLINPNQLRHYGIDVQDNPYHADGLHIASTGDDFIHTIKADGTTKYFDSRTPTNHELATCPHIVLSSPNEWNHRDVHFPQNAHHFAEGCNISQVKPNHSSASIEHLPEFNLGTHNYDRRAITRVISKRLIAVIKIHDKDDLPPDVPLPKTFATSKRHAGISAETLSEWWLIGLAQAQETIKVTTQNCTRSAVLPLSRRYRAD